MTRKQPCVAANSRFKLTSKPKVLLCGPESETGVREQWKDLVTPHTRAGFRGQERHRDKDKTGQRLRRKPETTWDPMG